MKNIYKKNIKLNEVEDFIKTNNFRQLVVYEDNNEKRIIENTFINKIGDILRVYKTIATLSPAATLTAKNNAGYVFVFVGGKAHTLHRLVASTWVKKKKNRNEIDHKDGNKSNNSAKNLVWCTRQENMDNYYQNHYNKKGE